MSRQKTPLNAARVEPAPRAENAFPAAPAPSRAQSRDGRLLKRGRGVAAIGVGVIVAVVIAAGLAGRHWTQRSRRLTPLTNASGVALLTALSKGATLYGPNDSFTLGNFKCRPWTGAEVATGAPNGTQQCELEIRVRNDSNTADDGFLDDWQWGLYAGRARYDGSPGTIASMFPDQTASGRVVFTTPANASPSRIEIVEMSPPEYDGHYYELSLNP